MNPSCSFWPPLPDSSLSPASCRFPVSALLCCITNFCQIQD
ncbi:hypothetical protein CLOM621_06272 [Clostridium sp. M62/1]|nr:hypothetical protein CLOM621_06272 [Clostridium sp. M62/1]